MRIFYTLCLVAASAFICTSCTKTPTEGKNDKNLKYFEAWAKVNLPDARKTALGSYVIEEIDGYGRSIDAMNYLSCNYTVRSLDGTIQSTSYAKMAQQIGTYSSTSFYGPSYWQQSDNSLHAGIEEILAGKHVGAKVKAAIPGWLQTTNRYDDAKGYLDNASGTDYIYELEIVDAFDDLEKYELDSLIRFIGRNFPKIDASDTSGHKYNKYGLYYQVVKTSDAPDSTFKSETKVYLNYVGKLLNGTVFDTNIERVAKDAGIYKSSSSYKPTYVTWNEEDHTKFTFGSGGSSIIEGFSYAISKMKPHEKGTVIFHSKYGYSASGSGNSIPAYSPLIFEIELVDPEE